MSAADERRARGETIPPLEMSRAIDASVALDAVVRAKGAPAPMASDLLVAVAHTADAARILAVATTRTDLVHQLVGHILHRGFDELWPADAARIRAALALGECEAAVAIYFRALGQRWDKEWLVTVRVGASALPTRRRADARADESGPETPSPHLYTYTGSLPDHTSPHSVHHDADPGRAARGNFQGS